jgi:hypothetical protein
MWYSFPQAPATPDAAMQQATINFAALFAASLLVLPARQISSKTVPPQDRLVRPTAVIGITVSPVEGAPFSATVVIESEREWFDGEIQVRRTINLIARDSNGRTHNESRRLMPEYFHGSPGLISIRLFDPSTRIKTTCDPALHIARQQVIPKESDVVSAPNASVHIEDLGASTLNGLKTKGTRRTFTISAKASGIGKPVDVVDEEWYSEDLHMNLLVRHSDPRLGAQTIGISGLKREEPPASMFDVPAGYQVLSIASPDPANAPAPQSAGQNPSPQNHSPEPIP